MLNFIKLLMWFIRRVNLSLKRRPLPYNIMIMVCNLSYSLIHYFISSQNRLNIYKSVSVSVRHIPSRTFSRSTAQPETRKLCWARLTRRFFLILVWSDRFLKDFVSIFRQFLVKLRVFVIKDKLFRLNLTFTSNSFKISFHLFTTNILLRKIKACV